MTNGAFKPVLEQAKNTATLQRINANIVDGNFIDKIGDDWTIYDDKQIRHSLKEYGRKMALKWSYCMEIVARTCTPFKYNLTDKQANSIGQLFIEAARDIKQMYDKQYDTHWGYFSQLGEGRINEVCRTMREEAEKTQKSS